MVNPTLRRLYLLLTADTNLNIFWKGRRREIHTECWWGNLREIHHLEGPEIDGKIILFGFSRSGMGGLD